MPSMLKEWMNEEVCLERHTKLKYSGNLIFFVIVSKFFFLQCLFKALKDSFGKEKTEIYMIL